MRFQGKVAVVTGGGSGIGAEMAIRLVGEGAQIVIADIAADQGANLAERLGTAAAFRQVDVADHDAVADLMLFARDRFGGLDLLFNNAGIGSFGQSPDLGIEDWKRVIDIDLSGVFFGCRAAIPLMRERGGGAIVNTASISGLAGDFGFAAYNAAKAGVINYTRTVAIDHAREGIRANVLCPGPVDTPLFQGVSEIPGAAETWRARIPVGRFARPEEMAAAALFLASDDASYITGAVLAADGGLTAHTGQPNLTDLVSAAGLAVGEG